MKIALLAPFAARCAEDGLCSTMLFLLLLIGALTLEALLALRHEFSGASRRSGAPDGEEAAAFEWPEDAVMLAAVECGWGKPRGSFATLRQAHRKLV